MNTRRSKFVVGILILAAAVLAFGQAEKVRPRDYTARLVGHELAPDPAALTSAPRDAQEGDR